MNICGGWIVVNNGRGTEAMFERYTVPAREVIFMAKEEACRSGAPSIQARHLLLGILRSDAELAAVILPDGNLEALREELLPERRPPVADLPGDSLSPAAKRALARATEEADLRGRSRITPAHLLAGLFGDDTRAATALKQRAFDLDRCRSEFIRRAGAAGDAL